MLKLGQSQLTKLCKFSEGFGVSENFLFSGYYIVSLDYIEGGRTEEFANLCRKVNAKYGNPRRDYYAMKEETIRSVFPKGTGKFNPELTRTSFTMDVSSAKARVFQSESGDCYAVANESAVSVLGLDKVRCELNEEKRYGVKLFVPMNFKGPIVPAVLLMCMRCEDNPISKLKRSASPVAPGIESAQGFHKPKKERKAKAAESEQSPAPSPRVNASIQRLQKLAQEETEQTDEAEEVLPPLPPVNPNSYVVIAMFHGEPAPRMVAEKLTEQKAYRTAKDYGYRNDVAYTQWFALQ
jgi:hypothetical protein